MLKEEQNRLLKGLISHLDANTNVDAGGIVKTPADTYTCEERFDLEWKTFFKDYPQIVGMSGDLAEPNSFVTIEDFGSSIIAARDPQGKFRAYANVCSHRGAEIEQEKKRCKV
jgi:phenylpropionate dioxygenase-like ring-hydroxylating dioxygenase large terminal subunit